MYTIIDLKHFKIHTRIHLFHLKFTTDNIKNHPTTKATNKLSKNWNKWSIGQQIIAWKFTNCGANLSFPCIKWNLQWKRGSGRPPNYTLTGTNTSWFVGETKEKLNATRKANCNSLEQRVCWSLSLISGIRCQLEQGFVGL